MQRRGINARSGQQRDCVSLMPSRWRPWQTKHQRCARVREFWSKIVCLCSSHIYAKHQIARGKIAAKTPPYITISISIIVTALLFISLLDPRFGLFTIIWFLFTFHFFYCELSSRSQTDNIIWYQCGSCLPCQSQTMLSSGHNINKS